MFIDAALVMALHLIRKAQLLTNPAQYDNTEFAMLN